jgi:hypothetical protein
MDGQTEFKDLPLYDSPIIVADGELFRNSTGNKPPHDLQSASTPKRKKLRPTRISPFTESRKIPEGTVIYDIRGRMITKPSMTESLGTKAVVRQMFIAVPRR